mgnify:CR=1 FL=1|jgi:hypothetical protein
MGKIGGCLGIIAVIAIGAAIIEAVSDGSDASYSNSSSSQSAKNAESKPNNTPTEKDHEANTPTEKDYEANTPTEKDYEANTPLLNYRKAAFEEYDKGQMLRFRAQAWRIVGRRVTVNTKKDDLWGYIDDTVFLEFGSTPEILVNDIMWVYGKYDGVSNLAGNRFPIINVDHFGALSQ